MFVFFQNNGVIFFLHCPGLHSSLFLQHVLVGFHGLTKKTNFVPAKQSVFFEHLKSDQRQ